MRSVTGELRCGTTNIAVTTVCARSQGWTMSAIDRVSLVYGVTSTLAVVLTAVHAVPLLGARVSALAYRGALLAAAAGLALRCAQLAGKKSGGSGVSLESARLVATELKTSNNFQYLLLAVLYLPAARPMLFPLIPLAVSCAYQALAFYAKHFSGHPLWARFGARAYALADEHALNALVLCAITEIMLGFFTVFELFSSSRSFLRLFFVWNFLKHRYRCPDNTVLRVKYKAYNASFYHQTAWQQLADRASPFISKVPQLERVLEYPKRWFLSG